MSVAEIITEKLRHAFHPVDLDVQDESYLHAGHASAPEAGESHFRVKIVAEPFEGKSRVERHRMINEALSAELKGPIHALALEIKAPSEA